MDRQELIIALTKDTQEVIEKVQSFSQLDGKLLSIRPTLERWSVLECIEHLNIAQSTYFQQINDKLTLSTISTHEEFKSNWIGNYFVKSMKPKEDGRIPSPMKTLKKFVPPSELDTSVIDKFLSDQNRLLSILEECRPIDLNKIKIKSAIGAIVTFKLGDALRFMIAHNQRHVLQMERALEQIKSQDHVIGQKTLTLVDM